MTIHAGSEIAPKPILIKTRANNLCVLMGEQPAQKKVRMIFKPMMQGLLGADKWQ